MITREVALRRLTRRTRWVVLDVETTNSDQGKRILSVGINHWRMDPTTSQPTPPPTEWWVDPGVPVENTRIHHITTQLLADRKAVPFTHYLTKLDKILTARRGEQVVLVAHYARFDVGVLHLEYDRAGRTLPDVAVLDTWSLARWLDVGASRYNLTALLNAYGLRVTQHHNAAADAYDTAELLRKLLSAAADQQVCDFDADHPTKRKEPVLRRTGDYPAAPPNRGTRATRRSRFTFIERPKTHQQAHKALPKKPTLADLDSWLEDARSCAELRCPGLPGKVDGLRVGREQMAAEFLNDWERHLAADDPVAANTSLGAALLLLPKVTPAGDAPGWLATWEPKLRAASRCADGGPGTEPVDGCPECRSDRACPADAWKQTAAMLLVGAGRNFNVGNSRAWLAPAGRLKGLAAGQADIAAYAGWLLYEMLSNRKPDAAAAVAELTISLGLTQPRLAHVHARRTELAGDGAKALTLIDAALAQRAGSTDRGWADLLSYRDAVAARQVAATRTPAGPKTVRVGHTAPANRPERRRFQLTPPSAVVATTRAPKARSRKRRALHAGR